MDASSSLCQSGGVDKIFIVFSIWYLLCFAFIIFMYFYYIQLVHIFMNSRYNICLLLNAMQHNQHHHKNGLCYICNTASLIKYEKFSKSILSLT